MSRPVVALMLTAALLNAQAQSFEHRRLVPTLVVTSPSTLVTPPSQPNQPTGPSQPIAPPGASFELSTSSLSMSAVPLDESLTRSALVLNTGSSALSGFSATLSGAASDRYSATHNCPASLAAGQSCELNVTYTPTSLETTTATLTAAWSQGTAKTLTLTGSGSASRVLASASPLDFGVPVFTASTDRSLTFTNISGAARAVSLTLQSAQDVSVVSSTCGTAQAPATLEGAAPGNTCTAVLRWAPSASMTLGADAAAVLTMQPLGSGVLSQRTVPLVGVATPTVSSLSPTYVNPNGTTLVTVTGAGFKSGFNQLMFNGSPASTTFVSSTTLRASAPAGTAGGTANVSVYAPAGGSVSAGTLTYYDTPTLDNPSLTLWNTGALRSAPLTGTRFAPGATVNLTGAASVSGLSAGVASSTALSFLVPSGLAAGSYNLQVVNPGDLASSTVNSGLFVRGAPTITAISPSTVSAGQATTVTLTGSNFYGQGPNVTFGAAGTLNATPAYGSTSSASLTIPGTLPAGSYQLVLQATDSFGNVSATTSTVSLTVQATDPGGTVSDTGLTMTGASPTAVAVSPDTGLICAFSNGAYDYAKCQGMNANPQTSWDTEPFIQNGQIKTVYSGATSNQRVYTYDFTGSSLVLNPSSGYSIAGAMIGSSTTSAAAVNPANGYLYVLTGARKVYRLQWNGDGYSPVDGNVAFQTLPGAPLGFLAFDGAGNFYAATSSNVLLKYDASGNLLAQMSLPSVLRGLAVSQNGNVYFTLMNLYAVYKAPSDLSGYAVFAGSPSTTGNVNGAALSARFSTLRGLQLVNGRLYVSDWGNSRIRVID